MKEHLSEGGNILQVCGPLADNNVPLVMGGFAEALENSDITIAGTEHADGWLAETGFAVTDAYLNTGEVPTESCAAMTALPDRRSRAF